MGRVTEFRREMQPARPYPETVVFTPLEVVSMEVLPPDPPLHVQALKGELAPDTCCACGCHIPLKPLQTSWPMGVLYGDPHLDVTRALAYTLEYECGPAAQVFYDSLGADERLMFARQLSRVAVTTYLEELAK